MQISLQINSLTKEILWKGTAVRKNGSITFWYKNPKTGKCQVVTKLENDYKWTQTKSPKVIIRVGYEKTPSQKPHYLVIEMANDYVELPHWTDGSGERPVRRTASMTMAERLRNGE